jgi:urease gamma subunit
MTTQINPPFDGSAPCPGCNSQVREISAVLHNFLTRCDVSTKRISQAKAFTRLWDLRSIVIPETVAHPHPAVDLLLKVAREMQTVIEGMTLEGHHVRWTNKILDDVEAMIPKIAEAVDGYELVSHAHFADARHSQGSTNLLRTERGSRFAGHVAPNTKSAAYSYTVELLEDGPGDLTHNVCQSHFALHPHFKAILAEDPLYYEKVYCETCKHAVPWTQCTYHAPA